MLKIKEEKLKDMLIKRGKHIKTHIPILETVAFIASFLITILLSDFFNASPRIKFVVILLSIVYLFAYCLSLYGSHYSVGKFYEDICSVAEKEHNFSIILLRDTSGVFPCHYVLTFDERWKCWLFPYVKTNKENDSQSIEDYVKSVFKINDFKIAKVKEEDFTKHSVSANLQKTYHHTFYLIEFNASKSILEKKTFRTFGAKYRWFTTLQMKENKRSDLRNHDVISYVEENFGY